MTPHLLTAYRPLSCRDTDSNLRFGFPSSELAPLDDAALFARYTEVGRRALSVRLA
jgi:hypothetical protein